MDTTTIQSYRARRAAGEKLVALAAEAGITWQALDKMLRHGPPQPPRAPETPQSAAPPTGTPPAAGDGRETDPTRDSQLFKPVHPAGQDVSRGPETPRPPAPPTRTPGAGGEALTRVFQPTTLAQLLGQGPVVAFLQHFVGRPHSSAMLFEGETGVGKTSAALALAHDLGCDLSNADLGGLRVIASGEQNAEAVREAFAFLHYMPMLGSGWKVLIVNEADRMSTAAETIWLDRLETLPARSLVVFTTNNAGKLSNRFQDRCQVFHFAGDAKTLRGDALELVGRVWKHCTGRAAPERTAGRLVKESIRDGCLSFRRLLQLTERELAVN